MPRSVDGQSSSEKLERSLLSDPQQQPGMFLECSNVGCEKLLLHTQYIFCHSMQEVRKNAEETVKAASAQPGFALSVLQVQWQNPARLS